MDRILKNYPAFLAFQSCRQWLDGACREGRLSLVKHYFRIGRSSKHAIHCAVVGEYPELVTYLLEKGAPFSSTTVDYAIAQGNLELVKGLYQRDWQASIDKSRRLGAPPRFTAWLYTHLKARICSYIVVATQNEQWDIAEYFCQAGRSLVRYKQNLM